MRSINDFTAYTLAVIGWLFLSPTRLTREIYFEDRSFLNYRGNILVASTHKGVFDPWVLLSSLPFGFVCRISPFKILAKPTQKLEHSNLLEKVLLKLKVIDLVYWLYGCVMVLQSGDVRAKLIPLQKEIDLDNSVLIFPEGKIHDTQSLGIIKTGISVLRKDNPDLPFLFVAIKYEKTKLPFLRKTKVIFSGLSLEHTDDYQQYVANRFNILLSKI